MVSDTLKSSNLSTEEMLVIHYSVLYTVYTVHSIQYFIEFQLVRYNSNRGGTSANTHMEREETVVLLFHGTGQPQLCMIN